eukprot:TRINITY_DN1943_c0_g1_i4.p1 TRINITY_DN1943_c0_g1~~TRINITY_DN1943_c0_g1_i4.p1  ORF type:complete len:131 (-),score=15.81 TRINITY_DN1943_c0_g1_i4:54-446(-)
MNIVGSIIPGANIIKLSSDALSRNQEAITEYKRDPLILGAHKPQLIKEMFNSIDYCYQRFSEIKSPILIIHSESDEICKIRGSLDLMEGISSTDKELMILSDHRHEFYEDNADDIFQYMTEWILTRTPTS